MPLHDENIVMQLININLQMIELSVIIFQQTARKDHLALTLLTSSLYI